MIPLVADRRVVGIAHQAGLDTHLYVMLSVAMLMARGRGLHYQKIQYTHGLYVCGRMP